MVGISNATDIIGPALKNEGWRTVGNLFGRSANNGAIYARNGRNIVLFGPFQVSPKRLLDPGFYQDLQGEFEDFLQRVKDELEDHLQAVHPRGMSIVFHGGGVLEVPDWFLEWCLHRGIQVHFAPDPQDCARREEGSLLGFILQLRRLLEDLSEGRGSLVFDGPGNEEDRRRLYAIHGQ